MTRNPWKSVNEQRSYGLKYVLNNGEIAKDTAPKGDQNVLQILYFVHIALYLDCLMFLNEPVFSS